MTPTVTLLRPDDVAPVDYPFELPQVPPGNRVDDDFIPFFNESILIQTDIAIIRNEDPNQLPFIRYLTLTNMDYFEFQDEASNQAFRAGLMDSLATLLNFVSTDVLVSSPEPINREMTIFRIDIRDYGWNQAEWERLTTTISQANDKEAYPYQNNFDDTVLAIANQVQATVPIARADWLLSEAMKPFSYYDLTNTPNNLGTLENILGIDIVENVERSIEDPDRPRVIRAGIAAGASTITSSNRVIERHQVAIGNVWVSYNFENNPNNSLKDIFSSPLGPGQLANGNIIGFQPDIIEFMYPLPNGLPGFFLGNGNGTRLNDAPTNILFNAADIRDNGVVSAGSSCVGCHASAVFSGQDSLRVAFENVDNDVLDDIVLDAIQSMYVEQQTLESNALNDTSSLQRKLLQTLSITQSMAEINSLLTFYEQDMSFDRLASELNITRAQLERLEPRLSAQLRLDIQAAKSGNLRRDDFEELFPQLLNEVFNLQQRRL